MTEDPRISGKHLGEFALPEFCPRCAWLKLKTHNRLPYQIFPGIFSSIDAYTKRVVHSWIDRNGGLPGWMAELEPISGYIDPPHHSRFQAKMPEYGILLTGAPDGILTLTDGTLAIIDYKTARYTANQDELLPMYAVQLNSYALIAERLGFGEVTRLALIYAEPVTDVAAAQSGIHSPDGFSLSFAVSVHPVDLNTGRIFPLLKRARSLFDLPVPPPRRPGCQDCARLDALVALLARQGRGTVEKAGF